MHWNRFLLAASLISSVFLHVPEASSQTTPFVHKKRYAMARCSRLSPTAIPQDEHRQPSIKRSTRLFGSTM